eukprot:2309108-Pleurochrysis_carterae.AAC.1
MSSGGSPVRVRLRAASRRRRRKPSAMRPLPRSSGMPHRPLPPRRLGVPGRPCRNRRSVPALPPPPP